MLSMQVLFFLCIIPFLGMRVLFCWGNCNGSLCVEVLGNCIDSHSSFQSLLIHVNHKTSWSWSVSFHIFSANKQTVEWIMIIINPISLLGINSDKFNNFSLFAVITMDMTWILRNKVVHNQEKPNMRAWINTMKKTTQGSKGGMGGHGPRATSKKA